MDILEIIINFFNVTDSSNLVNKNWIILSNKNEYLGERIKAFFFISFTNHSLSFHSHIYNLFNQIFIFQIIKR